MVDAAYQVGAVSGLGILDTQAGQARSCFQIDEEAGAVACAQIHGQAQVAAAAWAHADYLVSPHYRLQAPAAAAQQPGQFPQRVQVDARSPVVAQRIDQPVGVRAAALSLSAGSHERRRKGHSVTANDGVGSDHHFLTADLGAHDGGDRARRDLHDAITRRAREAGAHPYVGARSRTGAREFGPQDIELA